MGSTIRLTVQLSCWLLLTGFICSSPFPSPLGLRKFALEDLVPPRREFYPQRVSGQWISDKEYLLMDAGKGIQKYNAQTDTFDTYLTEEAVNNLNNSITSFSKDGHYLLVSSDIRKVYRWSSTAKYYVYQVATGTLYPVGNGEHIQTCLWVVGPRTALAFVRDNNVYYVPDVTDPQSTIALTDDGVLGQVYNGVADWIYEEEILNSADAMWSSPEGSYLAVATFNDTLVESAKYPYYGIPATSEFQYPQMIEFKYPKGSTPYQANTNLVKIIGSRPVVKLSLVRQAGRTNPTVYLRVYTLTGTWGEDRPILSIPAPVQTVGADHILGSVEWASDKHLVVLWLNRRQNTSVLLRCNLETVKCASERQQNEPNGWIDISDAFFDESGTRMVDVSPAATDNDRHPHAVLLDFTDGLTKDLSPGNLTVVSILGWNQATDTVYYLVAPREAPWERQVWSTREGAEKCITCDRPVCKSVSAMFAPGAAYALLVCTANNIPPHTFMFNAETHEFKLWRNNSALSNTLAQYELPTTENSILQLQPGALAHVRLMLPPDLDRNKKYPMVMKVYAGPGSSRVLDKYELDYSTYLSGNRSFVVCYVDVRGSGMMGISALHSVNNALGTVEVEDTLRAIKELVKTYSFIDGSRVGVWGWSYGGYTSALMLARDDERLLRCAASIAPVTSWLYYDSIYTERYMGVPAENLVGYERSDLLLQAKKLKGKTLMLVHGNADDNVHYQHSMLLSKVLQHEDIAFDQMSYPDENHSLAGVSRHFYHTLDRYWTECFE